VGPQNDNRPVRHSSNHFLGELPIAHQDASPIDRHAIRGEPKTGDVKRSDDRPDAQTGEIGGNYRLGVRMDHGIDIAAGAEHFAVQWQLVRRLVTVVEFSWGALFTVQRDQPDVFCTGERESSLVRTTTSDQQSIFVDAQADVAEDAWRQAARRQDATGQRDGVSFSV
jgi:hypothetical protein